MRAFPMASRNTVLWCSDCRRMRGFTLLELLMVIVVIGVMAGLAVATGGGNAGRELRRDAARMQQALDGVERAHDISSSPPVTRNPARSGCRPARRFRRAAPPSR